ncbi:hypothetical protein HPB48_004407 [Haemaphysalis longicornis]|uniref:Sushi domain-containing protein n=1 Tax=Haemaphysalis longicornis TaxID=44386 RepID=A0A9J6G3F5_HAELO|nr:hypothetical protein HPB48_004407 [Haemaphysalis longicornis]
MPLFLHLSIQHATTRAEVPQRALRSLTSDDLWAHADAGCPPEPPEIVNGYYNVSGEETCWNTPAEGSLTSYYCLEGFELQGPRELVCRNGSWVLPLPLLTSSAGPPQGPAATRPFKNVICGATCS